MEKKSEVQEIKLSAIIPNRFQPRKAFDPADLQELMDSIKTAGVLEPIIVRLVPPERNKWISPQKRAEAERCPEEPKYEIIMGERRFRACQALKLATIPAVVKEADDHQMLEWALIENTHRKDLNPIERAKGYKQLADTFQLTHQEVAERVGVGRTTVTDFIRLLSLPPEIQADVGRQTIRVGHAMAILAIPDSTRRLILWQRVKNEDLSVRNVRIIVDAYLHPRGVAKSIFKRPAFKEVTHRNDQNIRELEQRLREKFGAPVNITIFRLQDELRSGLISINFYSEAEYKHILEMLDK
jgi:ParB family chromosome partitioning protein